MKLVVISVIMCCLGRSLQACPVACTCKQEGVRFKVLCEGGAVAAIVQELPANTNYLSIVQASNSQYLTETVFTSSSTLEIYELFLVQSSVQQIGDNTFAKLRSLNDLSLKNNNIQSVSVNGFSGLVNLRKLDLSFNQIRQLGGILSPLTQLRELDLSFNILTDLQTGAFRTQTSLVKLHLDGNVLHNLHGYVFQGLGNLKSLSLRQCNMNAIVSDLFSIIRRVDTLDFGQNHISSLPTGEGFRNVPGLRHLFLDHNEITSLNSNQFSGMTLDTLDLSHNRLKHLSSISFQYFNVRQLDLSSNLIYEIESNALRPMAPQLEVLNLANNQLQAIPVEAFEGLYRLQDLNLSKCSLELLHNEQLDSLQNLRVLDISENYLKMIPPNVVVQFQHLLMLSLQGNVWHCDCHIKSFQVWLQSQRAGALIFCAPNADVNTCRNPKCTSPNYLTGQRISEVQEKEIQECKAEANSSPMPLAAVVGVAVGGVLIFAIGVGLAIFCCRRLKNKQGLPLCGQSQDSSHIDMQKKHKPFQELDVGSLNESDHNFTVRRYFTSMVPNPSVVSRGTPSLSRKDSGSQRSLSSSTCSYIAGIESAV